MDKLFDEWNQEKKRIEKRSAVFMFKEAEIWWCAIGTNIGNESCGKGRTFQRPILVVKKLSKENCIGIPISTQKKYGSWFAEILVKGQLRYVLLYQIRMFSMRRLQRRLAVIEDEEFTKIKEKLGRLLELS